MFEPQVATGGSLLGVGNDLAGSLRYPALFSGCVGFKPTAGRISASGVQTIKPGKLSLKSVYRILPTIMTTRL